MAAEDQMDPKDRQLDAARPHPRNPDLTTDQGVRIRDTDNSLRVGDRGPTLLEDFQVREKLTHFDHERIPERVVHARGAGAYGYFEPYDSMEQYTCADFLRTPGQRTPVFVRFSTVAGPRGSADTVRDVRGFATKFYTREGNYDLVGNNMPVFFIQDAAKFPDFVHSVKPEPDNEIPTGASAHDTFWDFCSLQPESTHMLMWVMSDRAIPRSYRMMQGFGVHTFRFVTADGRGTFVKFHWRPRLGVASMVWDEAQIAAGRDPDFHRRDLWEAIEAGRFPEYELGVQLVAEADEHSFDVDLLDPTKIIPEEEVPVRLIGRMVLNRNPDDFFAETEQVAFHTANVVPGIDFSNDPLLQGRNFSYLDTQLIRLGGPNFSQLPVNRPLADVYNNHRDGYGQKQVHQGVSYSPNSLSGNVPSPATVTGQTDGVYRHYERRVDGDVVRRRSPSFADHYSQARLFWNSMADWEKRHIVAAFRFELGHVADRAVRERMVGNLVEVADELARAVAEGIGVAAPEKGTGDAHDRRSPALSLQNLLAQDPGTRKVAVLAADGVDGDRVTGLVRRLAEAAVFADVLAPREGELRTTSGEGETLTATRAISATSSVLYDAVVVAGGKDSVGALRHDPDARRFVEEAYRHGKPLGGLNEGAALIGGLSVPLATGAEPASAGWAGSAGVVTDQSGDVGAFAEAFLGALAAHRYPERPPLG